MFLMQYLCLDGILPFSKSYPEIDSDQPQSAAEESLLTRDITQLFVQRFV